MKKAIFEFDLHNEEELYEFNLMVNAFKYKLALDDMYEQIFRPNFKHGYSHQELRILCEKSDDVVKAIEMLHELYRDILETRDIK